LQDLHNDPRIVQFARMHCSLKVIYASSEQRQAKSVGAAHCE
jgi:hypothetical protein